MLVMIDNYDSFTFNLVHYLGELGQEVMVIRNDAMTAEAVMALGPRAIVLSPGPCDPDRAGICLALTGLAAKAGVPLLGICLGHQAIGQYAGGKIVRARPMHGKVSAISHCGAGLFSDLPNPLMATRYHSLVVERDSMPDCLDVTATAEDGAIVMGISHREYPLHGVQFHPESIATERGHALLGNFLGLAGLAFSPAQLAAQG